MVPWSVENVERALDYVISRLEQKLLVVRREIAIIEVEHCEKVKGVYNSGLPNNELQVSLRNERQVFRHEVEGIKMKRDELVSALRLFKVTLDATRKMSARGLFNMLLE